ncbi:hypothetical protein [Burkholderia vietnamiensis]|nr:hypothetical protein [Burkholderia vietnamiensis]
MPDSLTTVKAGVLECRRRLQRGKAAAILRSNQPKKEAAPTQNWTGVPRGTPVYAPRRSDWQSFYDVNQTARGVGFSDPSQPTLISKLVAPGDPNGIYGEAHAEIGVIQQAYNAGLTQGQPMTIVVRGLAPCNYCQSDLVKMADAAGLSKLTVVNGADGSISQWVRGSGNKLIETQGAKF